MVTSVYYTVISNYHGELVNAIRAGLLNFRMNMYAVQFFAEGLSIHFYPPEAKSIPIVLTYENISGIDKCPTENKLASIENQ